MFFGTVVSSSCLLVEFVGGVLLVRGSAPESKGSTGGSAPAEPPSDAIGWRVGSPVRLPRVGDGPTGSDYRTEIVDSRRPTKGPGQVADPQSFQTGVCRVQPSTPAGGRPVDPWAGRTLRPGQPDHLGGRPYGPAGDTGPLWPDPHGSGTGSDAYFSSSPVSVAASVHSPAETAGPPSAGFQTCSPVSLSTPHSPSAHSTSAYAAS